MKRMMTILMMLMMVSVVSALPVDTSNPSMIKEQVQQRTTFRNASVAGLQQAQLMVTNEVAAAAIENALERLQERDREMLQRMENVQVAQAENDNAVIQAQTRARLFNLIEVDRGVTFKLSENGEIERYQRPLDFLFRYENTIQDTKVI